MTKGALNDFSLKMHQARLAGRRGGKREEVKTEEGKGQENEGRDGGER